MKLLSQSSLWKGTTKKKNFIMIITASCSDESFGSRLKKKITLRKTVQNMKKFVCIVKVFWESIRYKQLWGKKTLVVIPEAFLFLSNICSGK